MWYKVFVNLLEFDKFNLLTAGWAYASVWLCVWHSLCSGASMRGSMVNVVVYWQCSCSAWQTTQLRVRVSCSAANRSRVRGDTGSGRKVFKEAIRDNMRRWWHVNCALRCYDNLQRSTHMYQHCRSCRRRRNRILYHLTCVHGFMGTMPDTHMNSSVCSLFSTLCADWRDELRTLDSRWTILTKYIAI